MEVDPIRGTKDEATTMEVEHHRKRRVRGQGGRHEETSPKVLKRV